MLRQRKQPLIKGSRLFALCLLLIVAMFSGTEALQADNGPTVVRLDSAELELDSGAVAEVQVVLENAQDVYGIDVRLRYDVAVIEIVDADAGKDGVQMIPGAFPQPDFLVRNTADNAAGSAHYAVTQVNPTPPASGEGVVFALRVRGKTAGQEGQLNIESVEIADRDGMILDSAVQNSIVRITGGSASSTPIVLPAAQPTSAAISPATAEGNPTATAVPDNTTGAAAEPPAANTQPTAVTQVNPTPAGAAHVEATAVSDAQAESVEGGTLAQTVPVEVDPIESESAVAEPVTATVAAAAPQEIAAGPSTNTATATDSAVAESGSPIIIGSGREQAAATQVDSSSPRGEAAQDIGQTGMPVALVLLIMFVVISMLGMAGLVLILQKRRGQ